MSLEVKTVKGTYGWDVSQQFLHRSKDRRLGLEPNSFSDGQRTDAGDSSQLGLEPNSFSVGQRTDAWDSSRLGLEPNSFSVGRQTDAWESIRIGLEPNSFSVGRQTDVWDSSRLGLESIESSRLGLESINSFGHIMCKEVPCLTVLGTRELTHPRRMCAMAHCANCYDVCRYIGRINSR